MSRRRKLLGFLVALGFLGANPCNANQYLCLDYYPLLVSHLPRSLYERGFSNNELGGLLRLLQLPKDKQALEVGKIPPLERMQLVYRFEAFHLESRARPWYDAESSPTAGAGEKSSEVLAKGLVQLEGSLWDSLLRDLLPAQRREILSRFDFTQNTGGDPAEEKELRHLTDLFLDAVVGYDFFEAEKPTGPIELRSRLGDARWSSFKLKPHELMTSYFDVEQMLAFAGVQEGQTVGDLGSAYGRVGFMIGARHPELKFRGYEINPLRVKAANAAKENLGYSNIQFEEKDLSSEDFWPPSYIDVFILFDPVNEETRPFLMDRLHRLAQVRKLQRLPPLKIIAKEGRGKFLPFMRSQDWLTQKPGEIKSSNGKTTLVFEANGK